MRWHAREKISVGRPDAHPVERRSGGDQSAVGDGDGLAPRGMGRNIEEDRVCLVLTLRDPLHIQDREPPAVHQQDQASAIRRHGETPREVTVIPEVGPERSASGQVIQGQGGGIAIHHGRQSRATVIPRRSEGSRVDRRFSQIEERLARVEIDDPAHATRTLAPLLAQQSRVERYDPAASVERAHGLAVPESSRLAARKADERADVLPVERRHHRQVRTHQWTRREVGPEVAEHDIVLTTAQVKPVNRTEVSSARVDTPVGD